MANDYLKKFAPVATHLSSPTSATKSAISGLVHCSKKSLFDHLVGGRKQRRRNSQTEHFRGLEING